MFFIITPGTHRFCLDTVKGLEHSLTALFAPETFVNLKKKKILRAKSPSSDSNFLKNNLHVIYTMAQRFILKIAGFPEQSLRHQIIKINNLTECWSSRTAVSLCKGP